MALQKCKECGNQVSSSAENCPKCGAPVKTKRMKVGWFGLIIILVGLGIMLGGCEKESEKTEKVAQEVKKKIRKEEKQKRIEQEQAKKAENEKEAFHTHIEEHYQRLLSAYQNKNYEEVDKVFKLFKDNDSLKYKDVETINKKVTIARLEEKVRPIPASQVEDNLRIYRKLAVLDPNNPKYQKKVAYYSKKLEEKQSKSLEGSTSKIKQDDKVTIVVPGTVARLCPYANCGENQHITRIPEGTVLTVEGIMEVKSGRLPPVKWFEVTYKGKRGWLSIFNTDKAP